MRTPDIPRPIAETHRPRAAFPPNATDCHAHIFGPQDRYPLLPRTHFVPHECPLSEYLRMLRILGCERGVLVQPSVYGTNNSAIEEALQSGAFNLRGVAVVAEDVTDQELERLHGLGFRGIRINTASATPGLKLEHAPRIAERIKHLGWHLQFFVNFRENPWMEAELTRLPVNIVIDHFGRIAVSDGLNAPPFTALLRLLKREHCFVKLMGPYFITDAPGFTDTTPFAQAMIHAAPDRVVWGTDWPHPSARELMPNDGDLADLLIDWAPDEDARRRILVDNPQRLYAFTEEK
ncbi:MAG TPA: amidohydrolase family protein [Burkholderiales bacterium]|nr:amidohydrolase family protein [Burkholderiales bacterium]